jgi:molecular chaperone DnaJ
MSLYLTLGIAPTASPGDIKRAYRRLARKFHPELNPGDQESAERFRRIVEAYETLVDPERRRQYDRGDRSIRAAREASPFEFEGFDFSVVAEGAAASTFGDLFADVLREVAESAIVAPARGADIHQTVTASFAEAIRGGTRSVTVTRLDTCGTCRGAGRVPAGLPAQRCAACGGAGELRGARGHMVFTKTCPACEGTGARRFVGCTSCNGAGLAWRTDQMPVSLPAGVRDGETLRLHGLGNRGRGGAPDGDLYVRVEVAPHPSFQRVGDDVHVTVPIAIHEAAFGARIEVPSPHGPCRLRIVPGTQSGQQFRVRGRGVVSSRTGTAGDLVVHVRLVLPPLADEHSREIVRELGRAYPEDVRKMAGAAPPPGVSARGGSTVS